MNNLDQLFDAPGKLINQNTCKQCNHRDGYEYGSKIIQYCAVRKSSRTQNGQLKIFCKNKACNLFEFDVLNK